MSDNRSVPRFGSLSCFCRLAGISRTLAREMLVAGTLPVLNIAGRRFVGIEEGLARLDEAARTGARVDIPGPAREAELARKTRLREQKRAEKRAREAETRRARRRTRRPAASADQPTV